MSNKVLPQNTKTALKIKGQGQLSPKFNHFWSWQWHIFPPRWKDFWYQ